MIKVRLHGDLAEIQELLQLINKIEKRGKIKVLNESEPYKDRGKSAYSRVYLDVKQLSNN